MNNWLLSEEKKEEINSMSIADIDAFTRQYGITFEINNGAITGACLEEQYIDAIFREKEISKTINDVYLVASGELIDITDEEARYIAERYFVVEDIKKAKWDTIKEELEKYITNERSSTKFFEIEENDYE